MADGAASAEPEGAGVRVGAALAAGAGATVGVAEATGGDAAGRAAATTGFFFFATGFFGGVTACRVT